MYRHLLVLVSLCWLLSSRLLLAEPVAPNPSFEVGVQAPESWTPLTEYIGDNYLWETEILHSGKRSISTRATRYRYGRWRSESSPVLNEGYTWYTLTGFVKTERNNGEVYLAIAWLDEKGHLITTSDSQMLPEGDNDWQPVTVSALPAEGVVQFSLWCISNHNSGQTWFDDLSLTPTKLPAVGKPSYDQFLNEYPTHPLAVAAHLMRVMEIYTQAKWMKEKGVYDPDAQKRASQVFAQAASIPRLDNVLARAVPPTELVTEQKRYEALVDRALWQAAISAHDGQDFAAARGHLEQIVQRNQTASLVEDAQQMLDMLSQIQAQAEGGP